MCSLTAADLRLVDSVCQVSELLEIPIADSMETEEDIYDEVYESSVPWKTFQSVYEGWFKNEFKFLPFKTGRKLGRSLTTKKLFFYI